MSEDHWEISRPGERISKGGRTLVNEFDKMGMDEGPFNGLKTPVYELTNGWICCSVQPGYHTVIVEFLNSLSVRGILVATTEVADPFHITAALKAFQKEDRIFSTRSEKSIPSGAELRPAIPG